MSDDNKHITDDLLVKYLLGEADPAESREAELWINANETNKKYYADFKLIWDESERIAATSDADENGAWLRLQNRIAKTPAERQPEIKQPSNFGWLKIAASILLISAIGYFTYDKLFSTSLVSKGSGLATLTQNLPDGSLVTLNSNSLITYPAHFRGGQRLVQLSGEGFFKITPDKTKPFIIKINAATVSVVGTSFNVKNVKGKTEVIVETGIVKVIEGGKQVMLRPGQKVITGGADLIVQESHGSLYNYYITKALVCNRTPLYELVDKLNQVYGSDIKIANPQLNDLPITTTFKGQTLPQVLNIVAQTFKIKVENKGGQILLK